MQYEIDYQFLPKGAEKLEEIGNDADLVLGDRGGFGIIPEVGDYVEIPRTSMGEREIYRGKVCRRFFKYILGFCHIRIIIEEVDDQTWTKDRGVLGH